MRNWGFNWVSHLNNWGWPLNDSKLMISHPFMHPSKSNNFCMKHCSVKCFVSEIYVCHWLILYKVKHLTYSPRKTCKLYIIREIVMYKNCMISRESSHSTYIFLISGSTLKFLRSTSFFQMECYIFCAC